MFKFYKKFRGKNSTKGIAGQTRGEARPPLSRTYKIIVGIASVVASAVLVMTVVNYMTRAGALDPSAPPADTSKTLDNIYDVLTIDTTATAYGLDSPGTPASTMHTLQEIYDIAIKRRLPDTGQNKCSNATVESACPVANFPGQDAEYDSTDSFTCDLSYTDNSNGTVTDNCTGLMWQKCSFGLSGSTCGTGTATTTTWGGALKDCDAALLCNNGTFSGSDGVTGNCSGAGGTLYSDWRLPNIRELMSIINYATTSPAVTVYFPATFSSWYWSSSPDKSDSTSAWFASLIYGLSGSFYKTTSNYLRCVRGQ